MPPQTNKQTTTKNTVPYKALTHTLTHTHHQRSTTSSTHTHTPPTPPLKKEIKKKEKVYINIKDKGYIKKNPDLFKSRQRCVNLILRGESTVRNLAPAHPPKKEEKRRLLWERGCRGGVKQGVTGRTTCCISLAHRQVRALQILLTRGSKRLPLAVPERREIKGLVNR